MIFIDWGHVTTAQLQGEWGDTPADPLLVLIAHSDCDGVIHPQQAGPLALRLQELIPSLESSGAEEDFADRTRQFITGLQLAVDQGEDVIFC